MPVEIMCGKCGARVATMTMLRPVRDVVAGNKSICPSCGHALSTTEFAVEAQEG